ncbi:MAG: oxidoreductase, partial [Steroidobacteraceae bacterium]
MARRLHAPMQAGVAESFCTARTWAVGLTLAALLASTVARATVAPLAPLVPFTVAGRMESTAQLKGHPTLLWLLSTWCGSCAAGLQALRSEAAQLEMARLHVIVLRNYKNGGYPGPHIRSFVKRFAPALLSEPNWTFGQA